MITKEHIFSSPVSNSGSRLGAYFCLSDVEFKNIAFCRISGVSVCLSICHLSKGSLFIG